MDEGDFLTRLAAPTPTPGGGAVACHTAATAAALGQMVVGLAEKRAPVDPTLIPALTRLRADLLAKAEEDARSFEAVMAEIKKPKDAPGRKEALAAALEGAARVPLAVMATIGELAGLVQGLRDVCPKSALSDWESALVLLRAGREIARMNVVVNLKGAAHKDELQKALAQSDQAFAKVLATA